MTKKQIIYAVLIGLLLFGGVAYAGIVNNPSAGGGMEIGGAVTSGTAGSVLFVDGSGNLGENTNLSWDTSGDNLDIANGLRHVGNTNTLLSFSTGQITLTATNVLFLTALNSTQDILTINDSGTDIDFRVESTTLDGALFVDAGLDFVGIGTTSPDVFLHVTAGASATTTVEFGDIETATVKTCFNVNQADGSAASFFFAGGAIVVETNACK